MRKEIPNFADDEEARKKLETLYQLYALKLLHTARRLLEDSRDAEAAVESAFIRTMYILHKIQAPEAKRTYQLLNLIVQNLCYGYMRKGKKKFKKLPEVRELQTDVAGTKPSELLCPNEENDKETDKWKELREFIGTMPQKYRMPLLLFYAHGLSVEESGNVLGITKNQAGIRLLCGRSYVLRKLRKQKKEEDETK